MGFRTWLIGVLGGSVNPASGDQAFVPPPPSSSAPGEEEMAGLNFRTAIDVHRKWKTRLQAVVDGTSTEQLAPDEVCRDDRCALGKWIHGSGGEKFGSHDTFQALSMKHADFHLCAGEILRTALAGETAKAQAALKTGEFAQHSQSIVMALAKMYNEIADRSERSQRPK